MTLRRIYLYSALALAFAAFGSMSLHAQTGCDDSPENPTAILMLVGGAGAALSQVVTRFRKK